MITVSEYSQEFFTYAVGQASVLLDKAAPLMGLGLGFIGFIILCHLIIKYVEGMKD